MLGSPNLTIVLSTDTLNKWTTIHKLYNEGKFNYDILRNQTANTTFKKTSFEKLKKMCHNKISNNINTGKSTKTAVSKSSKKIKQ
jgi:hypothetical protein